MSDLSFQTLLNGTGIHQTNNYDVRLLISGARVNSYKDSGYFAGNYGGWKGLSEVFANVGLDPTKEVGELFSDCCYQVNPGIGTIQTSNVRTYGETFEVPYSKSYEALNLGFYLDADGKIYKMFSAWIDSIYNPATRTLNFLNNYAATIEVRFMKRGTAETTEQDKREVRNESFKIVYEKAYPKTISPIPLNGMSGNTPTQFDVTFAYRRALVYI